MKDECSLRRKGPLKPIRFKGTYTLRTKCLLRRKGPLKPTTYLENRILKIQNKIST